ncbi:MAG: HAMP domain-containing histidine kinase [Lachnospiraceae bacterium]|nr:HAMP domain-containing histidine kinase [Lachnospiraceae bacterium]
MKKASIRLKITLWFSAILIVNVVLAYLVVLSTGRGVIQKTVRDSLISTVEGNIDEVEYYFSLSAIQESSDVDYYLSYGDGYLEIDDDFLDKVNDVYSSLYQSDGTLLYGENPIASDTADLTFLDSEVQRLRVDGTLYYVFDRALTADGLDGLWLRGIVSEEQGELELSAISRASLVLLPGLVLLAIFGGFLLAGRVLAPIRQIADTASQIRQGDDLKKRIKLSEGKDELHQLATEFNEMFARLDTSFQEQQQFVSDASHELRTPVAVINAQCELTLEEEKPDTAEYREALETILRQGQKLNRLIGDMLGFTRLKLQPERYAKETLDLTALVSGVCADMALIREKGIALTCSIQGRECFTGDSRKNTYSTESRDSSENIRSSENRDSSENIRSSENRDSGENIRNSEGFNEKNHIRIYGNYALITRLLTNLISNAYRYGKPDGHIWVSLNADSDKHSVTLSVRDDGIGIAPDQLKSIFRRFYQVDPSRSGGGSGLGLAMVQEIADFHGGTVTVDSELGHGSIFTVCLLSAAIESK